MHFSTGACLLFICVISSASLIGANDEDKVELTYGVIVDCGSSGTRAHIFNWNSAIIYPELLNDIEPLRDDRDKAISYKITPGLSSKKDDPEGASDYMKPIMDFITNHIPESEQSSTGIYIMATAGMRLLDDELQAQIMDDIAKDISSRYNFAKVNTNVISGATEGMYRWITVNSKAKRFAPAMDGRKKLSGANTYAIVEMGGASIQVTYQLNPKLGKEILDKLKNRGAEATRAFMSQIVEPKISRETEGHRYELLSITFLGLGSNSARDNYLDMLVKQEIRFENINVVKFFRSKILKKDTTYKNQPFKIKDPCMPRGSKEIVEKPMLMLSKKETKTMGYLIENDQEDTFKVEVTGTGSHSKCKNNVRKFLQLAKKEGLHCKPEEPCTMSLLGTEFVPFYKYDFLGLGELYYSTSSMMKLHGQYDHRAIKSKTTEMCELSFESLEQKYPDANKFDESRSRLECFKAVFVDTFLTEGLMMPKSNNKLFTVNDINGDDLDWTLGAVLDKSLTIELATEQTDEDLDELDTDIDLDSDSDSDAYSDTDSDFDETDDEEDRVRDIHLSDKERDTSGKLTSSLADESQDKSKVNHNGSGGPKSNSVNEEGIDHLENLPAHNDSPDSLLDRIDPSLNDDNLTRVV